ncbi:MAG: hypothetical protein H6729_06680 [Deltaproteobacteria bacterium]|nr:hypothetical protein [Deltaproteobacteria bacterium]
MSTEKSEDKDQNEALYRRGGQVNILLASRYDPSLVEEARTLSTQLMERVKKGVEDFEGFEQRVERSEEFSLHESAQLSKKEKEFRAVYLRGRALLDAIAEAEARRSRFGR